MQVLQIIFLLESYILYRDPEKVNLSPTLDKVYQPLLPMIGADIKKTDYVTFKWKLILRRQPTNQPGGGGG